MNHTAGTGGGFTPSLDYSLQSLSARQEAEMNELLSVQRASILEVEMHLANAVLGLLCEGWQPPPELNLSVKEDWLKTVPGMKERMGGGGVATFETVEARIECGLKGLLYDGPGSPTYKQKIRRKRLQRQQWQQQQQSSADASESAIAAAALSSNPGSDVSSSPPPQPPGGGKDSLDNGTAEESAHATVKEGGGDDTKVLSNTLCVTSQCTAVFTPNLS